MRNLEKFELIVRFGQTSKEFFSNLCWNIKKCQKLAHLELHFYNDVVCDEDLKSIAESLVYLNELTNLTLLFDKCNVTDEGLIAFFKMLPLMKNIRSLSVSENENTKITDECLNILSFILEKNFSTKLSELTLSLDKTIVGEKGLCSLLKGLKNLQNLSVLKLYLDWSRINSFPLGFLTEMKSSG